MTEELEQKAEEYISELVLTKYTESDTIPNIRQRFYSYNDMIKAYKDGYEQGQDEAKIICSQTNKRAKCAFFSENEKLTKLQKEIEELKWEQKQILEDNENYQKENEELKAQIKDLCSSLDIMNNRESELLAQIEKMKRCSTCKHKYKDTCYIKLMNNIECHNKDKWELAK